MIILDIKIDNLYAFNNFHMNMSYPKKIVKSTVQGEFLEERTNFRYKKVNIIMGSNATGKTSLGKVIMLFANYFKDGNYDRFTEKIGNQKKKTSLIVDFVTDKNILHRFKMLIKPKLDGVYREEDVDIHIYNTPIGIRDNYETCALRLDKNEGEEVSYDTVRTLG